MPLFFEGAHLCVPLSLWCFGGDAGCKGIGGMIPNVLTQPPTLLIISDTEIVTMNLKMLPYVWQY